MNSVGDPEQDSKKIADLLKYGAHSLVRIGQSIKQSINQAIFSLLGSAATIPPADV